MFSLATAVRSLLDTGGGSVGRWGVVIIGLLFGPGCAVVDLGVTNPIPGLSTVAVAPFFNLSAEPAADGHRFAEAYFSELQKVPGFQVLPVGVAEAAIQDHRLNLHRPDDALKLARILNVDAVVVGAVTDYSPYYPPRVGLQVSWYSPHPWGFAPGVPTEPLARQAFLEAGEACEDQKPGFWGRTWQRLKGHGRTVKAQAATTFRGQSPTFPPRPPLGDEPETFSPDFSKISPPAFPQATGREPGPDIAAPAPAAPNAKDPSQELLPLNEWAANSLEPLMSYTRLFDGADAALTATLRDYVELSDDLRSGGWEAWLHRSEDFIRFTAHQMIVETLALHGGESRRRVVFLWRREK